MIHEPFFYDTVRKTLFGGHMGPKQVDGLGVLLRYPCLDDRCRAYLLATTFLETDRTMQPITEYGARSYFNKYEPGTKLGKQLGNIKKGDGYLFRGRGYVMITGRRNMDRASEKLGVDFVGHPELVQEPEHAVVILYRGCEEGWFTGKKLGQYLTETKTDFVNARRVVNGVDRAEKIAGYAVQFNAAIAHTGDSG